MSDKKLPHRLTVKEAADLLHVSTRTVQRYIKERLITAVQFKRCYRIQVDALFLSFLGEKFSSK